MNVVVTIPFLKVDERPLKPKGDEICPCFINLGIQCSEIPHLGTIVLDAMDDSYSRIGRCFMTGPLWSSCSPVHMRDTTLISSVI